MKKVTKILSDFELVDFMNIAEKIGFQNLIEVTEYYEKIIKKTNNKQEALYMIDELVDLVNLQEDNNEI